MALDVSIIFVESFIEAIKVDDVSKFPPDAAIKLP